MQQEGRIYICAAEKDAAHAEKLSQLFIKSLGETPIVVACPVDYTQGSLPEDVIRLIKSCHLFFAVISRNSENSPWLNYQLGLASKIDLITIPIMVESFRLEGKFGISLGTADCININDSLQMEKMLSNAKSWLHVNVRADAFATAVDLGLSVKWASCNLGSRFPDIPGDYYAWGEKTSRKRFGYKDYHLENKEYSSVAFDETGNVYVKHNGEPFLKYNMDGDGMFSLSPMDDPATLLLGAPWRMPTSDEFKELVNECDWEPIWNIGERIGKNTSDEPCLNGYFVSSRKNGNRIFLPAAGLNFNEDDYECLLMLSVGRYGCYWARDLRSKENAFGLIFHKSETKVSAFSRKKGLQIRPVMYEDTNE